MPTLLVHRNAQQSQGLSLKNSEGSIRLNRRNSEILLFSSCRGVWLGCLKWRSPAVPAAGEEEEVEAAAAAAAAAGRKGAPAQLLREKSTQLTLSL